MATKLLIKLNYTDQAQSATADSLLILVPVLCEEKCCFIYNPTEKGCWLNIIEENHKVVEFLAKIS